MKRRHLLAALPAIALAPAVAAQSPDHAMVAMEAPPGDPTSAAAVPECSPDHAAMGHCSLPEPRETTRSASPGPVAADYADRIWGAAAMAPARTALRREHGGMTFSQVMVDLFEYDARAGRDGYRWDGAGWFGGDVDRLVVKSEGEGLVGGRAEEAEVQALYSRAIGPYFNLQAGIRQDFRPRPARTHAAIGIEGLAPYWFDVAATLFLSDRGDLSARAEGYYDQRITQRLVLQPRAEIDLGGGERDGEGGGAEIELGLRLRYEIVREAAPYLGIAWNRRFGRAGGEHDSALSGVIGIRGWF